MAARPERVIVWGAGGHGRVVADVVEAAGHLVVAFADRSPSGVDRVGSLRDREIMDERDLVAGIEKRRLPLDATAVALGIGDNAHRERAMARLLEGKTAAPAFVHPKATVSRSATLGRGTVVMPNAVVNADARTGMAVIINTGAIIEHDCEIDDAVHVSPSGTLAGAARVGRRSWIGAGSVVLQQVSVGSDVIVGAGAVVTHDVADGETVVGVPARAVQRSTR